MPPFISPKRSFSKLCPFSRDQINWIILKFGDLKNIDKVKKAFGTKFYKKNPRNVPNYNAFKRIIERFRDTGHTKPKTPPGPVKTRSGDIARFKQYFKNNNMKHLREASRDLGMSKTTLWRMLRVDLKWKAYKSSIGHVLTKTDKDRRLAACPWFINQPDRIGGQHGHKVDREL